MFKQCCSLIMIAFFLTGCAHHAHKATVPHYVNNSKPRFLSPPPFNQIDVKGKINVHLHTGYKKTQVLLTGDPRDLDHVTTKVIQNTLFLATDKGYPRYGAISADIRGTYLNRFHYAGSGTIRGTQLRTSYLDLSIENYGTTKLAGNIGLQKLEIVGNGWTQISGISSHNLCVSLKGNPKVQLTGFVSLAKLNIKGNGWLSLYWVKSNHLIIRAKSAARIQLAGIVNKLDVELWGVAHFKGRNLRALRSFVKTHDKSVAEISAVNHQSSLATDASDIYYFNIPDTRADFMALNGSVLNLREWSQFDMSDFHRYNKQFP